MVSVLLLVLAFLVVVFIPTCAHFYVLSTDRISQGRNKEKHVCQSIKNIY